MSKVVLGMSGGVDSSVAAYLLKEAGHEVIGLFMRNWDSTINEDKLGNPTLEDEVCEQEKDYQDALAVANHLEIPLHRVNFIETYWQKVFQYFISEYEKGRTPNPDVMCNKMIKFAEFFDFGSQFEPDYFAMGHFAQTHTVNGTLHLLKGADDNKDQTYFLSQLSLDQLEKAIFPIGHLTKKEVRSIALKAGLPTAKKKDSTGICFIGERDFNQFLNNYLPAKKGPIVNEKGDILGEHTGLMHYTIGQRKGIGIGGTKDFGTDPWFVLGKDLTKNTLLVGQGYHHPLLYGTHAFASSLNWIAEPFETINCKAKFRHRQTDLNVKVSHDEKGIRIDFIDDSRAVTPGQAVVFYDHTRCLGGAFIDEVYQDDIKLPR